MKIYNRKALYEYIILETIDAGIVLFGSEVKAIKKGKCNITESYCYIHNNEIWMKNSHISNDGADRLNLHDPLRDRKLLLKKNEIRKYEQKIKTPGLTIIPLSIQLNSKGLIKVNIGLCKGKKEYDKRESIKEKEAQREIQRVLKR